VTQTPAIGPGWHFGLTMRRRVVGRFILSEMRYPAKLRTPRDAHATPAFCLVLRGAYEQRFLNETVAYQPPSIVFRPPDAEHVDHISSEGASCFVVEPDTKWIGDIGLKQLLGASAVRQGGNAKWLMERVHREFRRPDAVTPLAIEGLMLTLGAELERTREAPACPRWLARTREALDATLGARVTLLELAAEAGVHPVHMASTFRRVFGLSVGAYARALRVDAAKVALRDSDRSINEIATSLGFSSQSHFTRLFQQHTGRTPLAYRRERRS